MRSLESISGVEIYRATFYFYVSTLFINSSRLYIKDQTISPKSKSIQVLTLHKIPGNFKNYTCRFKLPIKTGSSVFCQAIRKRLPITYIVTFSNVIKFWNISLKFSTTAYFVAIMSVLITVLFQIEKLYNQ